MNDLLKSKLIIEDGEYYYFFRSLNSGDKTDLERNITSSVDNNGNTEVDKQGRTVISRIRTDRQRVEDKKLEWRVNPKYELDDIEEYSLEEVFDHIKIRQRKDTNCISLSANANVAFTYYANEDPQYVVVKARKDDVNVFYAANYMFNELNKIVHETIEELGNPYVLRLLEGIKIATEADEVIEVIKEYDEEIIRIKRENDYGEYGKIRFDKSVFNQISYLSHEQNLEILKLSGSLEILEGHEMLGELLLKEDAAFESIIATMKMAIASAEFIHYGEISKENISRISRENLQAIAILQQYKDLRPEKGLQVDEIINFLIEKNKREENIIEPLESYSKVQEISIEEIYELTKGEIPYSQAKEQIESFINISRARKDAIKIISQMEREFGPSQIFEEMKKICMLPTPEVLHKQNNKGMRLCESVYLDSELDLEELKEIVTDIQNFSEEELEEITQGNIRRILDFTERIPVSNRVLEGRIGTKINKYYAEAIYDSYDWTGVGRLLGINEKNKIIQAIILPNHKTLKGNSIEKLYKAFEEEGFKKEEIPGIIINIAINKNIGETSYIDLIKSENPREIIKANMENINSIVSLIDIEVLLGKDKRVLQMLREIGVNESFLNSNEQRNLHSLYWAKRIVEGIDWESEIGRDLNSEEMTMFIERVLNYKKTEKTEQLSFLYKNVMAAGLTEEEAARFIIIGSIDSNYPIGTLLGHREKTKKFVKKDLEYYKNRRIETWDINKAKNEYKAQYDEDGKHIKSRLIKQGFNPKFIEVQRTDNLYWAEFLVNNMQFQRKISEEEKIAIMEQILDLTFLSKDGACKLVTTCESIREQFNIPTDKIASLLVNISINGAKKHFGYKKLVSSQEYWQELEIEDLNTEINEATLLEVKILKQIRENKEREEYKKQFVELGIEEDKIKEKVTKDLIWALALIDSIDFDDRLGRSLTIKERKVILECLLNRPADGSTIQGFFEKLNNLEIHNIPEVIVNAALGYSGVNGLNYSQSDSQDEIKRAIEGNYDKINTKITETILRRKINELQTGKEDYIEELKRIGVREDFFEEGNPNQKKPKNIYWINKIIDDYNWEKYLGRPIEKTEKAHLVERLLASSIMNANAEVYIGNTINYLIEQGIETEKICGYITNIALYGSKTKGVYYTNFFENKSLADAFLANVSSEKFVLDEECLKKVKLEVEMEDDLNGEKIYERMRRIGIRPEFLDKESPERKYYKVFYFVERIMQEYDFKNTLGRDLTKEERVAIIEKMVNIEVFSLQNGKVRLDSTFDIVRNLDLKGKDPLGVMLFIGFERIDTGKIKDPGMYYGKIVTSEPYARKIEDYIDNVGDTITEKTLRAEVIKSKMNRESEVEEIYKYYQLLGINSDFITKGSKTEKSLENLFIAKKILDDYDFEKTLGRELTHEEKKLILEAILDNNYWNVERRVSMHKLYNNIENLGLDKSQISGLFINLTMSKRKNFTYSKLAVDAKSTERLELIRDELKFEVDEQTLEELRKVREEKQKAKKVIKESVDPKRNAKGRAALHELLEVKEVRKGN